MGNFLGGTLSLGIGAYTTDEQMNPGDNGIYIIDGWKIVGRVPPYEGFEEQSEHDFDEMLRDLDDGMPEGERVGGLLDSVEVPVADLEVGDEVWMTDVEGKWRTFPVVGFGRPRSGCTLAGAELPYVARYDHCGDYSWNVNNYVRGETARVVKRERS